MKHANLVAWGILASLGLAVLNAIASESEDLYAIAGTGFFVFGIWAAVILLKNKA